MTVLYLDDVSRHAFEVVGLIIPVNQHVTSDAFMFRTSSQHIQQSAYEQKMLYLTQWSIKK